MNFESAKLPGFVAGQSPYVLRGLRRLSTTRPSAPQFIRLALPTKVDGRASYATRSAAAPARAGEVGAALEWFDAKFYVVR
jgi:hypothetical protein